MADVNINELEEREANRGRDAHHTVRAGLYAIKDVAYKLYHSDNCPGEALLIYREAARLQDDMDILEKVLDKARESGGAS